MRCRPLTTRLRLTKLAFAGLPNTQVAFQIGHLDALTYCLSLKPAFLAKEEQLKQMLEQLEWCQKALAEFLEEAGAVIKEGSDPPLVDTKLSEVEFRRIDAEKEAERAQKQF